MCLPLRIGTHVKFKHHGYGLNPNTTEGYIIDKMGYGEDGLYIISPCNISASQRTDSVYMPHSHITHIKYKNIWHTIKRYKEMVFCLWENTNRIFQRKVF